MYESKENWPAKEQYAVWDFWGIHNFLRARRKIFFYSDQENPRENEDDVVQFYDRENNKECQLT